MVTLLVGARYGVSQVVNHKLSILSTLTEFSSITRIELLPESDKVSLVKIYLQDIKVRAGIYTHHVAILHVRANTCRRRQESINLIIFFEVINIQRSNILACVQVDTFYSPFSDTVCGYLSSDSAYLHNSSSYIILGFTDPHVLQKQ